jgi:exosome complex RNA-binding protein Csl4
MTMDGPLDIASAVGQTRIVMLDTDDDEAFVESDPGVVVLTCANCGAKMDERKCKLICRCGYFLSCSDYY